MSMYVVHIKAPSLTFFHELNFMVDICKEGVQRLVYSIGIII